MLIEYSKMAAAQIEVFQELNVRTLTQFSTVSNEMLTPTILAPDYPLSFQNINLYQFDDIPEEDKISQGNESG